jgi:hypothetical protein
MIPARFVLFAVLLLLAAIPPAASTLVLSDVSYTPTAPLVPGSQQHSVATFAIIPSGATTFPSGHSLQMQTNLLNAKWTIQVTQDGRNAAQQTASGNAAFVSGGLLSYSTNHDIGLIVTLDGTVPQGATSPFMVLDVVEIDNTGNVVPGSEITLTQPVAGQTATGTATVVPTLTPPLVPTATQPARAPGFAIAAALFALGAIALLSYRRTA